MTKILSVIILLVCIVSFIADYKQLRSGKYQTPDPKMEKQGLLLSLIVLILLIYAVFSDQLVPQFLALAALICEFAFNRLRK